MTREEKAYSLGQEYFPSEHNIWARPNYEAQWTADACIKMAEWEHERLVEKACEWLDKNKHLYKEITFGGLITDWNKLIGEFRKAMKE